jgi:hypothetical protein
VNTCADERALQKEGKHDGHQQSAHTDRRKGKTEELDEGGAKIELESYHRSFPSVVNDVAACR